MTRIIDPLDQFFDDAGDPLVNGLLYFYETGTNTPLNTYADVNLTIPNANPLPLTGAGRCPNAYGSNQLYRVVLKTADGVQIMQRDNVGSTGAEGNFTAWNNERTYNYPEIVQYANKFYMSATNGNQDNTPDTATQWIQIRFFNEYEATFSYSADDYVTYNGILYVSVAGSNLGNAPSSNPNKWQKVNGLPVWGNATTYQQYDRVRVGSAVYVSVQNTNLNHDPVTDTAYTWWKPASRIDLEANPQLLQIKSLTGGGNLSAEWINAPTDSGTYSLPLANSVPANTVLMVSKRERYRTNTPVVQRSGSDTITASAGTDTALTFDYPYKTDILFTSNGSNTWSI